MESYLREPLVLAGAVFAAAIFTLAIAVFRLSRKWRSIFEQDPSDAAAGLADVVRRLTATEQKLAATEPRLKTLEHIGRAAFQKFGFARYNAFPGTGGEQSFVMALLDQENSGIVVSSIYSREGTRIYGKQIDHGAPRQSLSEEEESALRQALTGTPTNQ